jgi:hypothetical protein
MIAPKIPFVKDGQILSVNLVNAMIARTEYAAELLRQYKLVAGNGMYVEPHSDGTRVSYNQPVKGGATPTQPLLTQNERNLYNLVGRDGSGGKTFDAGEQNSLFGDLDTPYIIDLADIARLFGSSARVRATGVDGGVVFGYIDGLFFAWWTFTSSTLGTHTSVVPGPPSPAEQATYGIGTEMSISVADPFSALSFDVIYI